MQFASLRRNENEGSARHLRRATGNCCAFVSFSAMFVVVCVACFSQFFGSGATGSRRRRRLVKKSMNFLGCHFFRELFLGLCVCTTASAFFCNNLLFFFRRFFLPTNLFCFIFHRFHSCSSARSFLPYFRVTRCKSPSQYSTTPLHQLCLYSHHIHTNICSMFITVCVGVSEFCCFSCKTASCDKYEFRNYKNVRLMRQCCTHSPSLFCSLPPSA